MTKSNEQKKIMDLEIYIGEMATSLDGTKKVLIEIRHPHIPAGDNVNGGARVSRFENLRNAALFVGDWIEFLQYFGLPAETLKATVHLNIKSNKKVYYGNDAYEILSVLNKTNNITELRSFPSI